MNRFINRTISGTLILIISFICIYLKGYALVGYSMAITIFCLIELFRTFKLNDVFMIGFSLIFSMGMLYSISISNENLVLTFFASYFLIISIYYLFFNKMSIESLGRLLFSFIYISVPMGVFLKLGYTNLLWIVFLISWGTDTFAYLFGIIFGKHKLCPSISPKKTIEGALGGIFGSLILLNLFNYFVLKNNIVFVTLSGIILSIVAQIGDLFASKIKREMGIKDFSNIIKGHGGFLDRFDSIIFVTPLVYIVFYIFGGNI
ncbi:phosphatidate cytidylyltransferase [Parvimonas sp. KA00067]|uniref:phosphatidate cytidylyltransferase n=1 Tax=Parvimonas sp. KA00067 TaxID=1588755 RepID=UPI00079A89C4|nr:phosphatidate cytidylyltransferase [Parvimonas sp. KA00067]KXB67270.1 phosphatidate cytidylyltransferase [Parvimonas sp. KA00067]